ncbi:MAG: hypothetical protein Tsb0027_25450 [Wenzhouxiangellaceae bacterium]
MLRKFLHGLVFGSGFAVAFLVILAMGVVYFLPSLIDNSIKNKFDMSDAKEVKMIPSKHENNSKRDFSLYNDLHYESKIPENGGKLSIVIFEEDSGNDRPDSFQAWVTETEAYVISTNGDVPKIKVVPYDTDNPVDYASDLVFDNVGFHRLNTTMEISETEINRLMAGQSLPRENYMNGDLRITDDGVVLLIPNKYEADMSLRPSVENEDTRGSPYIIAPDHD